MTLTQDARNHVMDETIGFVTSLFNLMTMRHTVCDAADLMATAKRLREMADKLPETRAQASRLEPEDAAEIQTIQIAVIRAAVSAIPDPPEKFRPIYSAASTAAHKVFFPEG